MVKAHQQIPIAASHKIADKWGWFMVMGLVLLVLGIIASFILPFATTAAAVYIGIMMVIAGITQIIHSFGVKSWGRLIYWLLAGLLYTAAGIICLLQPIFAATVMTLMLGLLLVVAGIIRIIVGFQHNRLKGYGWLVAAGVISVIAGILVTLSWPDDSLWVLGMFVAIDLIIQGWSWVIFALNLRSHNVHGFERTHEKTTMAKKAKSKANVMMHSKTNMAKTAAMKTTDMKTAAEKTLASKATAAKGMVKKPMKNIGKSFVNEIDETFEDMVKGAKKTLNSTGKMATATLRRANDEVKEVAHKASAEVKNATAKVTETAKAKAKMPTVKTPSIMKGKTKPK